VRPQAPREGTEVDVEQEPAVPVHEVLRPGDGIDLDDVAVGGPMCRRAGTAADTQRPHLGERGAGGRPARASSFQGVASLGLIGESII